MANFSIKPTGAPVEAGRNPQERRRTEVMMLVVFMVKSSFFRVMRGRGILPLNRPEAFLVKQSDARRARILEDFRIFSGVAWKGTSRWCVRPRSGAGGLSPTGGTCLRSSIGRETATCGEGRLRVCPPWKGLPWPRTLFLPKEPVVWLGRGRPPSRPGVCGPATESRPPSSSRCRERIPA